MRHFLLLPVLLLAAGCVRNADADPAPPCDDGRDPDRTADARSPDFAFRLFREVAAAKPDSNVILSAPSAAMALALAHDGAVGETREQIAGAIGMADGSADGLGAAVRGWRDALTEQDCVELSVANGVWLRGDFPVVPEFVRVAEEEHGAEVEAVSFHDPRTPDSINAWASEQTRGRISRIVPARMDTATVAALLNAVYFHGRWSTPFTEDRTRPRPFTLLGGDSVMRPAMERTGDLRHHRMEGAQMVRIPYRGDRFAMYVVLPDSGSTLADVRDRLDADVWGGWIDSMQTREVHLVLPRFRAETGASLEEPLAALGMPLAFDSLQADFSGIVPRSFQDRRRRNVYVSSVVQKVFVEVDEEGTEAAAVTAIIMVAPTSVPPPPVEFVVDRPFLLAVRDDATGTLLFLGQIVDPSAT